MRKIMIVAGEVSGDQHAADLVRELKKRNPQLEFLGIGGEGLKAEGVHLLYHLSQLAILGITEVIKHLPFIRKVMKHLKSELAKDVDAIILVDYPGFNLRLAKIAKKLGIPVIYYISPQLWAWHESRVEKMRRYVDLLLVLFQFEVEFYQKHGITAHFVGHPLVDQLQLSTSEVEFRQQSELSKDRQILGIFPGSRKMEVENLLPEMLKAAEKLQQKFDCLPVIGKADQLDKSVYEPFLKGYPKIKLLEGQSRFLMKYAHAAMVASGTATLELGYLQTPMAVLYSVSPITYRLGKLLIKIDNIALVNIVCGKTVVPEFIQKDIQAEPIAAALGKYFSDQYFYKETKQILSAVKNALGDKGASERAAEKIITFFESQNL